MSDIFISYARADRALAEALANDLRAKGYRVWWDAELVGSDDFYEVILQALHDARAAIVIWTKASAKSRFVRDEARFALHLNKLVAVKEAALDSLSIPFGFQGQHTDDVANRAQIIKAIEKLGVKPGAMPPPPSEGGWARIAATDRVDEIVTFLGTNPPDADRAAAMARLQVVTSAPEPPKGQSQLVRSLGTSNWQAFWQGLTFRLPGFQLSGRGTWAAVGVALSYIAVSSLILFSLPSPYQIAIELLPQLSLTPLAAERLSTLVVLIVVVPLLALLWRRLSIFVSTRAVVPASILAIAVAFFGGLVFGSIFEALSKIGGSTADSALDAGRAAFLLVALASAGAAIWKIRAAS